jgi:hypothetical protein
MNNLLNLQVKSHVRPISISQQSIFRYSRRSQVLRTPIQQHRFYIATSQEQDLSMRREHSL